MSSSEIDSCENQQVLKYKILFQQNNGVSLPELRHKYTLPDGLFVLSVQPLMQQLHL